LIANEHFTLISTVGVENQPHQFGIVRSNQSGNTKDFTGARIEGGRRHQLTAFEISYPQQWLADTAPTYIQLGFAQSATTISCTSSSVL
jgi:hypothetical protein